MGRGLPVDSGFRDFTKCLALVCTDTCEPTAEPYIRGSRTLFRAIYSQLHAVSYSVYRRAPIFGKGCSSRDEGERKRFNYASIRSNNVSARGYGKTSLLKGFQGTLRSVLLTSINNEHSPLYFTPPPPSFFFFPL